MGGVSHSGKFAITDRISRYNPYIDLTEGTTRTERRGGNAIPIRWPSASPRHICRRSAATAANAMYESAHR
eukprot:5885238-Prymnesium_polylepis.1